jgi:hypothetical protein
MRGSSCPSDCRTDGKVPIHIQMNAAESHTLPTTPHVGLWPLRDMPKLGMDVGSLGESGSRSDIAKL